jgi:L-arabinokinase
MKAHYALADTVCALYPQNAMECFGNRIDTDIVGRYGTSVRHEIMRKYAIAPGTSLGLIYAGSFGMDTVRWERLETIQGWSFIGIYPLSPAPSNYYCIDSSEFRYQNLSASVDCVIGKVGYGTFSESILNGVPMLFVPRKQFAEYPVLERALFRWGHGHRLTEQAFFGVRWEAALREIRHRAPPPPYRSDGVGQCVNQIMKMGSPPE